MRIISSKGITSIEDLEEVLRLARKYLPINKNLLDDECLQQPVLIEQVGRALAIAKSMAETAHEDMKHTYAKIYLEKKKQYELKNKRVTESFLQSEVLCDERYIEVRDYNYRLRKLYDEFVSLKDAVFQKSYMIKELVILYTSEYFSLLPVQGETKAKAEEDRFEKNIQEIKKARRHQREKIENDILKKLRKKVIEEEND